MMFPSLLSSLLDFTSFTDAAKPKAETLLFFGPGFGLPSSESWLLHCSVCFEGSSVAVLWLSTHLFPRTLWDSARFGECLVCQESR